MLNKGDGLLLLDTKICFKFVLKIDLKGLNFCPKIFFYLLNSAGTMIDFCPYNRFSV